MGQLWYEHAVAIMVVLGLLSGAAVTPAVASYLRRPPQVVAAVLLTVAAAVAIVVGSARWHVLWRALTEDGPRTVWLLVALAGASVAAMVVMRVAGARGPSTLQIARVLSVLPMLALTVMPRSRSGFGLNGIESLRQCLLLRGHDRLSSTFVYDLLPNLLVCLPAGFWWATAARRTWKMAGWFVLASTTVEVYQALFTDRTCQLTDVASNAAGAVAGAALFLLLNGSRTGQRHGVSGRPSDPGEEHVVAQRL